MREAVGGALLYYIIIPIFIILIVFIGFIMRYASAYRAANYIVTQIETCQGYKDCKSNWDKNTVSSKYRYKGHVYVNCHNVNGNNSDVVYNVTLDVDFELPLVGKFTPFKVKVETKTMHNNSCDEAKDFEDVV